jgi:CARDB protein
VSFSPRGPARSRRPRAESASAGERQTILVRRAVAAGAGLLVLILLIVGFRGCLNARTDRAFRDYAADVRALMEESDSESEKLFRVLTRPKGGDALDIQNEINALSTDAEQLVERARNTDHPDELSGAQSWIVTALEFRRDGLNGIARRIPAALADKGRRPAIEGIAAQMQAFLASDVIYSQRALLELQQKFQDRDLNERFQRSEFLPDLGWLSPDTVESRLSKISSAGQAATPGIHGTGLQGVTTKPSGAALTEGGINRLAATSDLTFEVEVQNQGESEETDVGVSVSIRNDKPVNIQQTISRIAPGDSQTVSIPISNKPTTGAVSDVTVEVAPVSGEKVRDNNKATYQVAFTKG